MSRKYEYKTAHGMLKGITITSSETVRSDKWDKEWMDSSYIELLLNIDETWKTARQLVRFSESLRNQLTSSQVSNFLTHMVRKGIVESDKPSNSHRVYRRVLKYPKHFGGIG